MLLRKATHVRTQATYNLGSCSQRNGIQHAGNAELLSTMQLFVQVIRAAQTATALAPCMGSVSMPPHVSRALGASMQKH